LEIVSTKKNKDKKSHETFSSTGYVKKDGGDVIRYQLPVLGIG
jgi:hypothetical protein